MNILWLTWKDHAHPAAGGAEVVLVELSQRLIEDGHNVTWLTCGYGKATKFDNYNGIDIIRVGTSRYIHPFQALAYYLRHLRNKFDVVIEVVNTAPYFGVFFGKQSKRFLFYHQLAREVWFHEAKAPLSHFGHYVLEPVATRLLGKAGVPTITVSESTRQDLARFGFNQERTHIISQGIHLEPLKSLSGIQKYSHPTLLSLGALRAMKRTKDQIRAFELARKQVPNLKLKVAGAADGQYGQDVLDAIKNSNFADDIEYLGRVSDAKKTELMQQAHILLQTSLKEGWGLTISEAASQGTPAVVYDVDGLRDSVRNHQTGLITAANPEALSQGIVELLASQQTYEHMRQAAWGWSKELTFDQAYQDFRTVIMGTPLASIVGAAMDKQGTRNARLAADSASTKK